MLTDSQVRAYVAGGERFDVEFKGEERTPLSDDALVEAVVCLANGRGGVLLIGVEDDGRVTGARARHGSYTDPLRVEAVVANKTVPAVPVGCTIVDVGGAVVVGVEVPGMQMPVSTQSGLFKRRAVGSDGKPACVPFLYHDMASQQGARGAEDFTARVVPGARWEDLDPLEFERLRQTIQRNPGRADASLLALPDAEILRALGLGTGGTDRVDGVTLAALLLVGREAALRQFAPTHEVAFQVMQGTRVLVNDFLRGPLVRISDDLTGRFDARNESEEMAVGFLSVSVPDYSRDGFREAAHNALVHRDYTRLGAVHVQWRGDEIEIANPGGFVEGVGLGNLLVTAPRPRNPRLADACKRIGLVERTGRGIDTIYAGQLRYGRPAPDYGRSTDQAVQVVLHGGPANLALARWFIEQSTPEHPVSVESMILLNAAEHERELDVVHAARLLQRPEPEARGLLERLVERGALSARGRLRKRTYRLSPAAYRAIGSPEAVARDRDIEPIQQEEMVLQYVRAHGTITRRKTADLCFLDSDEARALLERLTVAGRLARHGEKRGVFYRLPEEGVP